MGNHPQRPTRAETDARLDAERGKTDEELARRTRAAEQDADQVVQKARSRAAAVLESARKTADDSVGTGLPGGGRARRERERSRQDEVLREEYDRADRVIADEREQRARLVAELLGRERDDTDHSLLLERADADHIVARRDDFLGMVSHDLRNELAAISLSAARILTRTIGGPGTEISASAITIERVAGRMGRLIGDLLDLVSMEAGTFTIVVAEHDARSPVADAIDSYMPIAAVKRISVECNTRTGSIRAQFDHQRIVQVLSNLLSNAIRFSPEGGTITVSTETSGEEVCFSVSDAGPGIPAERRQSVFDRFSRGDRRDRGGFGLGLYIAKRIVEAHHGRIWVESELGRGSTFRFMIPLPAGRPASSSR